MTTDTLAALAPATPAQVVTPPDADWVPVAFPAGSWKRWLRRRQRRKSDRPDEVWNGVYVVMPGPNNDHQEILGDLIFGFKSVLSGVTGVKVFPGNNISNNREDWTKNYRCPDVTVFLPGNRAENRMTHWLGGPDFAVEIVSKGDRSHDKFDFYSSVDVRELLFIERQPWSLELYRREGSGWFHAGHSDSETSSKIESLILPVDFRLIAAEPRPRIEILGRDGRGPWFA